MFASSIRWLPHAPTPPPPPSPSLEMVVPCARKFKPEQRPIRGTARILVELRHQQGFFSFWLGGGGRVAGMGGRAESHLNLRRTSSGKIIGCPKRDISLLWRYFRSPVQLFRIISTPIQSEVRCCRFDHSRWCGISVSCKFHTLS